MARHWFGGGFADWTFNVSSDGAPTLTTKPDITMWSAATGGTQYTDLLDESGAPITSVTSGNGSPYAVGQIPRFQGPDGVAELFADAGGSQRLVLVATDLAEVTDDHETRITALEAETLFAVKAADESVVSSIALQDDNDLVFAGLPASAVYEITGVLVYSAHSSGDFSTAWTLPAGASITHTARGMINSATGSTNPIWLEAMGAGSVGSWGGAAASNTALLTFEIAGILRTGAGGIVQFRWAQSTSNATATIVRADSYLKLTRVS